MRKFSENRFLADLYTKDSVQAVFLQELIDRIDNVAKGAGVALAGDLQAPPPVNAITVKSAGETVHATLTHGAELTRAIHYFVEADTSPSFTAPQIVSEGSRRTHIFTLPSLDDGGKQQNWYLRAYAQYPGSKPSQPVVLGGLTNPTALQLKGATKMTLLPSTGSGTASTTGQQGGSGRGKFRVSTPKVIRVGKQQAALAPVVPPVTNPSGQTLEQIGDGPTRYARTGAHSSYRPLSNPVTAHDAGTNVAINIASFTMRYADLDVAVTGGSVGSLSYNTIYFIYYDDLTRAGGSVTFSATTTKETALNGAGRQFVGSIVTPKAGAADTVGNNDGGVGAQGGSLILLYMSNSGSFVGNTTGSGTITNQSNINDGDTSTFCKLTVAGTGAASSAALNPAGFSNLQVPAQSIVLKVRTAVPSNAARVFVQYSLNGGTTNTTIFDITGTTRALTTDAIPLSLGQNLSLVTLFVDVVDNVGTHAAELDVYEAWIEITY